MDEPSARRVLIILDLNGTLLTTDYRGHTFSGEHKRDFIVRNKDVYVRPFLHTFLDTVFARYDVAVWTCNTQVYAQQITQRAFGRYYNRLQFVWSHDDCNKVSDPTRKHGYRLEKNLQRVWDTFPNKYNASTTILIDDSLHKAGKYAQNLLRIETYVPSTKKLDDTLYTLPDRIEQRIQPTYNNTGTASTAVDTGDTVTGDALGAVPRAELCKI